MTLLTLSRLQYNYDHKEECEDVTSGDVIKAKDCDIDNIETSDEEVLVKDWNISDKDIEEVFNVNVIPDVCDNDIKTQQDNDNLCQSIRRILCDQSLKNHSQYKKMFVIIDDIIYFKCKRSKHKQLNYLELVVPKVFIPKILEEYHTNNGHLAQNKTEDTIREKYWFLALEILQDNTVGNAIAMVLSLGLRNHLVRSQDLKKQRSL